VGLTLNKTISPMSADTLHNTGAIQARRFLTSLGDMVLTDGHLVSRVNQRSVPCGRVCSD
jgi:hypothetical protein